MNYAVAKHVSAARAETASVRKELAAAQEDIARLKREVVRLERASGKSRVAARRAGGVVKLVHVRVQLPAGCLIKD